MTIQITNVHDVYLLALVCAGHSQQDIASTVQKCHRDNVVEGISLLLQTLNKEDVYTSCHKQLHHQIETYDLQTLCNMTLYCWT